MKFAYPSMFWLLPLVAFPLSGFLWWAWRRRQELIAKFISARLVAQLKVGVSPKRQKARLVMVVLTVVFIIMALARPQWGSSREEVRQRGLDIMVAIDTSNSMLAEDAPPNRLARAKLAALDLMKKAKTDRLGLVAFAGTAFLECPLTLDDAAFTQSVNALDTKTFSQGGTAIGEAISEARKTFKVESENHKVLVLFTDGEDHDSNAISESRKAAEEGITIFTVGIGSPDGELLRVKDDRGHVDYIKDEQGNPVKSKLDEDTLQQIAKSSKGGFYAQLRGSKTMENLYDLGIAPIPKSEGTSRVFKNMTERFQWPLGIAIGFMLLEMFLPERSRSSKKQTVNQAVGVTNPTLAVLIFITYFSSNMLHAFAGPNDALKEYNKGNYPEALKGYSQQLDRKKDDPRLHFNTADAAYQSSQLEQAAKEFNEALATPDIQLQQKAYYNLGNTLFRMGQQSQEPDKKQENWENAIKQYENALKLNHLDKDADFNQQFVKKQLEELKKQQSQSQKNQDNKNQKDKKDQKDQKDQQSQDQQSKQDKQNDQNKDQQSEDKKQQDGKGQDSQKQQQASDKAKEEEKKKQEAAQKKADQKDQDQQQEASKSEEQKKQEAKEEQQKEAAMMAAGQMTPRQAAQMLDSQKGDDKVFQFAPPNQPPPQGSGYKNW